MNIAVHIERTPTGLVSHIGIPRAPEMGELAERTDEELSAWYSIHQEPLETNNDHKQLAISWEALGHLQEWDATGLFHILVVLVETGPLFLPPSATLKLPASPFEPTKHKATASHPRGYKGTIHQPPKEKRLSTLNLHPYLCDPKQLRSILQKLHGSWNRALEMMQQAGYETAPLSLISLTDLASIDPYFAYHHGLLVDINSCKLPTWFKNRLIPLLNQWKWKEVLELLSVCWSISLDQHPELMAAVCRLLAIHSAGNALDWIRLLPAFPHARRAMFITFLIEYQVIQPAGRICSIDALNEFHETTPEMHYRFRLWTFLTGLKNGVSADYLLAGFRFANDNCGESYRFKEILNDDPGFPYEAIKQIGDHVKHAEECGYAFALNIWARCGDCEGASALLMQIPFASYSPQTAYRFLCLLLYSHDNPALSDQEISDKWNFIKSQRIPLQRSITKIQPAYQVKFLCMMEDFLWYWDSLSDLKTYLPKAILYAEKLSQAPYSTNRSGASEITSDFIDQLSTEQQVRAFNAPDSCYANLEQACRTRSKAQLITYGMATLIREMPEFALNAFTRFPNKLLQVSKRLGTCCRPVRYALVREFKNHPLLNPTEQPDYELIQSHLHDGIFNPAPKKLQAYHNGTYDLSSQRIQRYTESMDINLSSTLLDLLNRQIDEELMRPFDLSSIPNATWEHSLEVMGFIDDNRRGFRRFLQAHFAGQTDYLLTHPKTQQWKKGLPALNLDRWLNGIEFEKSTNQHGTIRIVLEQDPLEALKLGTYVGSCLGIGGDFAYSAAAVVLDANKQVLYARDESNKVVARQLVAISEEGKLVCFDVYPVGADKELLQLFKDYDQQFAAALDLEIRQREEDYAIANILSQKWWDDYAWDLDIEEA